MKSACSFGQGGIQRLRKQLVKLAPFLLVFVLYATVVAAASKASNMPAMGSATNDKVTNSAELTAAYKVSSGCVSKHESGGKASTSADYYFVNEKGEIEKAGVQGNGGGKLRACPEGTKGTTCLAASWGRNQNNYIESSNINLAYDYLKSNGADVSSLKKTTKADGQAHIDNANKVGQTCANNAGCESYMFGTRMAANVVAADNYMTMKGYEKTEANWVYYSQLANWSPACMDQETLSTDCQKFLDDTKSWFAAYGGDCAKGLDSTLPTSSGGTDSSGNESANKTIDTPPDCLKEKDKNNFANGLDKAAKAYSNAVQIAGMKKYKDALKAQADNPQQNVHGKIEKTYCIEDIKIYFKTLRQLISDLKAFIIKMIEWLIEYILEKICELIISAIETLLEMICIPLPDLSLPDLLGFGLPETTCSGISLGDFVSIEKGSTSLKSLTGKSVSEAFGGEDSSSSSSSAPPSLSGLKGYLTRGSESTSLSKLLSE